MQISNMGVRTKKTDMILINDVYSCVNRFIKWLDSYGELSFDFETYYAGFYGRRAKKSYYEKPIFGKFLVAPLVACEAIAPFSRRFFWKKQRFPIADAHFAMGFTFLSKCYKDKNYYEKSVHFLKYLERTRCQTYAHFCWGYPYDWVTRNGTITKGTPLITSTPYAYEAFKEIYLIDRNPRWLEIMKSIAEHAANDIKDFKTSSNASKCSYTPSDDQGGVINAAAYRAFLLTSASIDFSEKKYVEIAEKNLNFVLQNQNPDGSWLYAADKLRNFVDHFHTCFVLKALAKIEKLTNHQGCKNAIKKGIRYYTAKLFDKNGLPIPFSEAPRMTIYKRELYNYAECINLGVLLKNRFVELDKVLLATLKDLLSRWQKPDGSFRTRKLFFGWDNIPMHRWAQSQIFRSLCAFLHQQNENSKFKRVHY